MVKVYGFEGCPYCKDLRERLSIEGVKYDYVNIELEENQEEFNKIMEVSKADEVPIVKVGNQLLVPNVSFNSIAEAVEITKKFLA